MVGVWVVASNVYRFKTCVSDLDSPSPSQLEITKPPCTLQSELGTRVIDTAQTSGKIRQTGGIYP